MYKEQHDITEVIYYKLELHNECQFTFNNVLVISLTLFMCLFSKIFVDENVINPFGT